MMRHGLLILAILVLGIDAFSQISLKPENSDCRGAIEISGETMISASAPQGPGNVNEISSSGKSPYYFKQEHHSVWYLLRITKNCTLSFEINPESPDDDYDFILFRDDGKANFCERIAQSKILPVRSVISRNDKSIDSRTGLDLQAKRNHIPPGPGPSFAAALPVKAGEVYYLVLDNVYPNGKGHSIRFTYSNCIEEPAQPQPTAILPSCFLTLRVTDRKTSEAVNAKVVLKSFGEKGEELIFDEVSSIIKALSPLTSYNLTITAPEYFRYTHDFRSPAKEESISLLAALDKMEAGNRVVLENIHFRGGTAVFLPSSYTALRNLLGIMKENTTLKIEIQGHVNKPLNTPAGMGEPPERLQKLSDERAFAVYEYLLKRGIEKSRLAWKGYSNSQMLYPYAVSEEEQQKNRRVEILILEK